MPIWTWPGATITRVIDGDSLIARLTKDIGFNGSVTFEQRLRLNRINTPPIATEQGKAAKAFVESWVAGWVLSIDTVKPYKYGDEWMAEVVVANVWNLSDVIAAQGFGVYWSGQGPRPGG